MELVHAHASYRFIILDEEEERPRLLVSCTLLFARHNQAKATIDLAFQAKDAVSIRDYCTVLLTENWGGKRREGALQDYRSRGFTYCRSRQVCLCSWHLLIEFC